VNDPALLIGYLLASHLTADFVVQTDAAVAGRSGAASRAARSLGIHALAVAICMLPFWLAFGTPGLLALIVVTLPHPFIDAAKTSLTRRVSPDRIADEWSPAAAALFLLDQAAHLGLILAAWWFLLRDAALNPWFAERVGQATSGMAGADVHRIALIAVVGWALLVVNTRAASFLVSLLLPPDVDEGAAPARGPGGYSVKLGPLSGRIEPDRVRSSHGPDAVGATIGGIERLLVVVLILGRAEVAIGLVVAAKTLARFKQLDERHFAERYLVGTLASITIAVASAMLARYVLFGA
jgi:hypothetical protein